MKRKVENKRSQIAALHEKVKGGIYELGGYASDNEDEGTSNRGHPALSLQNKKKQKGKVRRKSGKSAPVEGTGGGGARKISKVRTMRIKVANYSINSENKVGI